MRAAIVTVLALAFLGLAATSASAAEMKVGVVDVQYVIHKSKKGEAAKKRLQGIFKKKQDELDALQKKLLSLKEQLTTGSEMTTEKKRKELLLEYQQGLMELQEKFVKHQQELAKTEMDLMKPILQSLETVLTGMAKNEGYDLIMNRSEHGVLFTSDKYDITEDVLKRLDQS